MIIILARWLKWILTFCCFLNHYAVNLLIVNSNLGSFYYTQETCWFKCIWIFSCTHICGYVGELLGVAAGGGVVWKRCRKKRTKCVVQLENVYFFHVVSTILHVKLHQKYLYKVLMWLFQHFHYKCNTHKKVPQIFWYYTLFLHWIKCYFKVYLFCLMGYICLIGERGGEHMAKWWFV